jgi:hypothetical protein
MKLNQGFRFIDVATTYGLRPLGVFQNESTSPQSLWFVDSRGHLYGSIRHLVDWMVFQLTIFIFLIFSSSQFVFLIDRLTPYTNTSSLGPDKLSADHFN